MASGFLSYYYYQLLYSLHNSKDDDFINHLKITMKSLQNNLKYA